MRRIRTLKKYLDGESAADPNARWPEERWFVDRKANESRDQVTFELASKFDLAGQKIPKRQVIANVASGSTAAANAAIQAATTST